MAEKNTPAQPGSIVIPARFFKPKQAVRIVAAGTIPLGPDLEMPDPDEWPEGWITIATTADPMGEKPVP